jgi:uncharacterized protein
MTYQNNSNLLIIFVKNPVLGKVKTRLAKSIGQEKALKVYKYLIDHTCSIASMTNADSEVWYSDFKVDQENRELPKAKVQIEGDLGEKMSFAFRQGFKNGYKNIVIIGSDCPEITSDHIDDAFQSLQISDIVIGPSDDGGYYLLGMKKWNPKLFQNIEWSTSRVFNQTVMAIEEESLTLSKLVKLNDIDTIEDLNKSHLKQISF